MNLTFLFKKCFYVLCLLFVLLPSFSWAMQDDDPLRTKSPLRPIKGVEVNSYDFFYLSFTPTFDFFTIDAKGLDFLDKINPPRVRQEIERLAQMSQMLISQMPSMAKQIEDTLKQNQLAAMDSNYQTSCLGLAQNSFLLTPRSEDLLKTFKVGNYKDVFSHSQIDERIHTAINKLISFGFFPFERETTFLQHEIPALHVLGLDRFFVIEDRIGNIMPYEGGDGGKHVSISRCHEPCGSDGRFLEHLPVSKESCWCLRIDRQICYSKVTSKIGTILQGNIQCKKLEQWDDESNNFWKNKREFISVFDSTPYYKMWERGTNGSVLYNPRSEVSRFREIYFEAKKTYEEIKKEMTIEFIDQELQMLASKYASRISVPGRPKPKHYDWEFYPELEKRLHFSNCVGIVLHALTLASSAQEDFNREGPELRNGVLCVDVLSRSCSYRAKLKEGALPEMLKEVEYLRRCIHCTQNLLDASKLLKGLYRTYEDNPIDVYFWTGDIM